MDSITLFSLIVAVMTFYSAVAALLLAFRRRRQIEQREMRQEELQLRETQLRYSASINSRKRRRVIELALENLKILANLTDSQQESDPEAFRYHAGVIRGNTHAQLDLLLNDSDDEWASDDLRELTDLTLARENELRHLSDENGRGASQ